VIDLDPDPCPPAAGDPYRLRLDDPERLALAALVRRLAATPPALLDDAGWLAEARRLGCHLPARVLEVLRRYRHDCGPGGTLLLAGLPVDQAALPATPLAAGSVERAASAPATLAMLVGLQLGEVVAFRQEKSGALVQNVVPVPGLERSQSNAGSVPLAFHTENAFHAHRPDLVGLLCLRGDHAGTARTLVASVRHALPLLGPAERAVLGQERFETAAPPSFAVAGGSRPHAVLRGAPDDPDLLVDLAATRPLDAVAGVALAALEAALTRAATALVLRPGQLAFLDNRVVVHGRGRFTPRYDGQDRWLHRVYVQLDHRRSRACRPGDGQVLE